MCCLPCDLKPSAKPYSSLSTRCPPVGYRWASTIRRDLKAEAVFHSSLHSSDPSPSRPPDCQHLQASLLFSLEGVRLGRRSGYKTRGSMNNGNKYVKPRIHHIQTPHPLRQSPTKDLVCSRQFEEWTRNVWSDSRKYSLLDGQEIQKACHPGLMLWPRDHRPPHLGFRDPPCGPERPRHLMALD